MGNGLPYSIGAAVAHPGRQVVCITGDGGLTMLMGELATLAKYNLPVKVIILKNNVLGMIKWEQIASRGQIPSTASNYTRSTSKELPRLVGWPAIPSTIQSWWKACYVKLSTILVRRLFKLLLIPMSHHFPARSQRNKLGNSRRRSHEDKKEVGRLSKQSWKTQFGKSCKGGRF